MSSPLNIAILGSTGSIGKNAIKVVSELDGFEVFALSANSKLVELSDQAQALQPEIVVAANEHAAENHNWGDTGRCQIWRGAESLNKVAEHPEVDMIIAAIVGAAGLKSTWAGIEAGKKIGLANKETLVMAGPLAMRRAKETGAEILPIDSEHSAIFQAIHGENPKNIKRVVLTASGGPFRSASQKELENATVETALAHPTWEMGPKITVDSATMMNKSLELIEAKWLFDLSADQLDVVIHPQSIVHSLVEFVDGSVLAQLSPPDMKLPIQYALTYPDRSPGPTQKLDFSNPFQLDFQPPDYDRFPALLLGKEVASKGGTSGAVLNASNEEAVSAFLNREIGFLEIARACRAVLDHHDFDPNPSMVDLLSVDAWARKEIKKWIAA